MPYPRVGHIFVKKEESEILKYTEEAILVEEGFMSYDGYRPGHRYKLDWRNFGRCFLNGNFIFPKPPKHETVGEFLKEKGFDVEGYYINVVMKLEPPPVNWPIS